MHVLVTDDHQLFLDGIHMLLKKLDPGIVITECNSAEKAVEILESGLTFDLIIIDLCMPGMDGLSVLQRMQRRKVWLPLVVVSGEENLATIRAALDLGALGFIPKTHNSQEMIDALQKILHGDIYIPAEIEEQVEKLGGSRRPDQVSSEPALRTGITPRQYDVLQLLTKGYSNKQIAYTLFLTEHTVKAHVSALFTALSAKNRTDCVQAARRLGIVGD